ncbi:MAG: regulatory protein RecX [Candidatus Cloacimonetes bacterium]|jgi:SOS response regulatory protein OraA/RecX|nr:recombination regulator RecX [Candidatus Cloacimonadota bacterium]MDY0299393.1 regulatory protein RecX [Candidatus Cloacimonadaceae bacterium]MCB5278307.1 recombination regulator RecX [Candidatus Cloacimonadota bacterium]MCK9332929.1 recombination regulator RecX [Candidatus Cloacimonadota bacterium]MDD2210549.1 regulatory protein RecX [Candidatus Cloacimonadota bacterium]
MMLLKYWTKNKQLSFISFDDELWGVLPQRTLHFLFPFQSETEISPAQETELKLELEKRAWKLITDYLAKSEHSEYQCHIYLQNKHFHPTIVHKCLKLLKMKGYLSDRRFAEIYIQSMLERGKSKNAIRFKLKEHKISDDIFNELWENLQDPILRKELLEEQIANLLVRYRHEEPQKAKQKVFTSLYRKGFCMDEISDAWRDVRKP